MFCTFQNIILKNQNLTTRLDILLLYSITVFARKLLLLLYILPHYSTYSFWFLFLSDIHITNDVKYKISHISQMPFGQICNSSHNPGRPLPPRQYRHILWEENMWSFFKQGKNSNSLLLKLSNNIHELVVVQGFSTPAS